METNLRIPDDIAAIISIRKSAMKIEQEIKEKVEAEKRETSIQTGRKALVVKVDACLMDLPEWLRPYDMTVDGFDEDDFKNISEGYINLDRNLNMVFLIPGLAPIQFDAEGKRWRAASAYEKWSDYGPRQPMLGFNNSSYWRSDLEYTLIEAESNIQEFEKLKEAFEARLEADQREIEMVFEPSVDVDQEAREQLKETEEKALFDVFKDDPVAIHLLKAFLAIRQERSMFDSQLEDANSTMYSIEERYSRKAADLRRQAEDAERRAEEERNRVNDLEDDLSKAQKKIKQSQGW